MRILLDKQSKIKLLDYLKKRYNAKNIKELSVKLHKPYYTIKKWFYKENRYIDEIIIPTNLKLNMIDKKADNWGKIKGGKITYKVLIKKYGANEIHNRQSMGGKKSLLIRERKARKNFKIDIDNPLFLEFYGALLGDGWLSALSYNYREKRNLWWVGISGHKILDKNYLLFMQNIAKDSKKMKYVVRGIFDTDGYFDLRTGEHKPYASINITMKAPYLLRQIERYLKSLGFEPKLRQYRLNTYGVKQTLKWMNEIGSSNQKHIAKYNKLLMSL